MHFMHGATHLNYLVVDGDKYHEPPIILFYGTNLMNADVFDNFMNEKEEVAEKLCHNVDALVSLLRPHS